MTSPKAILVAVAAATFVTAVVVASVCFAGGEQDGPRERPAQRSASGCTATDRAYAERIGTELELAAGAIDTVGQLLERAGDNAAIIYNSAWRQDMIDALVAVLLTADALEESSPSGRMADVWYSAGELALALRGVARNLADGIDNANAGSISIAETEMRLATSIASTLTVQLYNACR